MTNTKTTLGDRIIDHMKANKFRVDAYNIVVLEDADASGRPVITTSMDAWNDRILLVKNDATVAINTAGTCEPGRHYTEYPMNKNGAARIQIGQHLDCWTFGYHFKQKALVQCGNIKINRDLNKDGYRTGDKEFIGKGWMTNFHTTADRPGSCPPTIGRWSAGCVVVQSSTVFYNAIMPLLRYSGRKTFSVTLIDASKLP